MMESEEQEKLTSLLEGFVNEHGKGPWDSKAFVGKDAYEKLKQQWVVLVTGVKPKKGAALQGLLMVCKAFSVEVAQMQQEVVHGQKCLCQQVVQCHHPDDDDKTEVDE